MKGPGKILTADQIEEAATLLKGGQLVAFPTETVYGLGAPIFLPESIGKIFHAKGRPSDNPLIVHIASLNQLDKVAIEIPNAFYLLASHFFPGPLTLVLKKHPSVPSIVSGGMETVAVRMPAHGLARSLIDAVGQPLVAPSANLSGKPSSTTAAHVLEDFGENIAAILDGGATCYGIESTVLSLLSDPPILLRPGTVSREEIEHILKRPIREKQKEDAVVSPGMKYRHYAPKAPVVLANAIPSFPIEGALVITDISAKNLYHTLRAADHLNVTQIVIVCTENVLKDAALMNRLYHAAGLNF